MDRTNENRAAPRASKGVEWWITTDFFSNGGEQVLGPFVSSELALEVRQYFELANTPRTFAIDSKVA